jgi:hypothetical protein
VFNSDFATGTLAMSASVVLPSDVILGFTDDTHEIRYMEGNMFNEIPNHYKMRPV